MNSNHHWLRTSLPQLGITACLGLLLGACGGGTQNQTAPSGSTTAGTGGDFVVGMVLVGPKNDAGWNQAHFEGIEGAVKKVAGSKLEYVDKVNPGDRPNVKGSQVADDLIAKGAKFIVFNSDDFKDDALETAKKHPNVTVIHSSGDYAWKDGKNFKNQPNLGNVMGRMEFGKQIAGCAAALGTETGKIGYLGALINDETRRYAAAAFLGAKYCWENYRKRKPEELTFKVTWIGFWFNIPGKTLDPTKVADDYYNGGFDVVMSGIDTPEAAVQGRKAAQAGKQVKYVHYDFAKGCDLAPDICLGVPFYNWSNVYADAMQKSKDGKYTSEFVWSGVDWQNLNNPTTNMIGFNFGNALGDNKKILEAFIKGMSTGTINLYKGPLKLQDGTEYVKAGAVAMDQQIWYMPQLFAGMEGPSK